LKIGRQTKVCDQAHQTFVLMLPMMGMKVIVLVSQGGLTMKKVAAAVLGVAGFIAGTPRPGLAAEAVAEAVATCGKQGYKVTATIVDYDGVEQAMLRGDGAMMSTLDAARDNTKLGK
jgi:uncharacterized protein GlcG (DUF336 family)